MPVKTLNARFVKAVKPDPTKQIDYVDRALKGFTLRVSPGGSKTWMLQYRYKRAKRRLTIGPLSAIDVVKARREARDAIHMAANGQDPAFAKKVASNAKTFADLATDYLEKHAKKRKRSWPEDARILNGSPHKKRTGKRPHIGLVKLWGPRPLAEIQRSEIRTLLEATAERAPTMANRLLALVRRMFNFAIEHDWIALNPCQTIKAPSKNVQRDRVLTEDEIARFWEATEQEQPTVRALLQLRLLTAQRGGEILSMQWQDLDLPTRWWTIPGERAKNGLAHRVPLSAPVLEILRPLEVEADKRDPKSPWVFASTRRSPLKPIEHAQKAVERVRQRSGVEFRGHDLRRTAASLMVGAGVPRLVVSKILNHVEQGVTAVYDRHSYDAEKRAALDAWGLRVMAIVAAKREAARGAATARTPAGASRGRVAAPSKAASGPRDSIRRRTLDTAKLAARDRLALRDFGDRLRTVLGPNLLDLRLYGAKAKGESSDDAELEVAVVVVSNSGELEDQVVRAAFDVDVAHHVHVSPRVLTPERLTDPAWRMTGFIREIERDGKSFQRHRAPANVVK
jgi:integrase